MTKPQPPTATNAAGYSCVKTNCSKSTNSCFFTCIYSGNLPPPQPPHDTSTSQSHVAPFLIAAVCILGISFLLLTTCTIILRWRFSHRRRRDGISNRDSSINGDDTVDHPIWHITTVGLQQSVIDEITVFNYKKLDQFLTDKSDCSVCLTEFEEGDVLRLLPKCSHAFHTSCIDTWLRSHKNCPVCRAPVVNEGFTRLDVPIGGSRIEGRGESSGGGGSSSGDNLVDDLGELPLEGTRIAEILMKNRELGNLSDLGVNYRFSRLDEEEPIKRSFSFNALAVAADNFETVSECNAGGDVQDRKIDIDEGVGVGKRGRSLSGLLMIKSSSIGRSLQKGPVSMKRSLSSGGKLFSYRRTKSQASILPL